jgi:hypothetical protein
VLATFIRRAERSGLEPFGLFGLEGALKMFRLAPLAGSLRCLVRRAWRRWARRMESGYSTDARLWRAKLRSRRAKRFGGVEGGLHR